MLQLIQHIVRTSASRDRTEINGALMDALLDMFRPKIAYVHSCFLNERLPQFYTAAGFDGAERFVRNAYLPERQHCHPIASDPLLARCIAEARPTLDILPDGNHRLLFPVLREERPVHAVDITVAETLGSAQRVALMGLLEYFGNHLSLLDYGETDTLTGLANRKTFDKHLFEVLGNTAVDAYINQALPADFHRRHGSSDQSHHWLGVIDIDHFKRINDTQGHLIGDEVLVMLSQLMRNSFRFDDQLFRFGGEEFIVVLQPTTPIGAHQTFERFRLDVAAHTFSRVGQVTASIGFSQLMPNDTPSDVIDRADEALYFAKHHGRNQVHCYETLVEAGELAAKAHQKGEVELF